MSEEMRPEPEKLLRQIQQEEQKEKKKREANSVSFWDMRQVLEKPMRCWMLRIRHRKMG